MGCVVFNPQSHPTILLPSFAFGKPKLGNSIFPLKEIRDGFSPFASQRYLFQLTVSSIRSDGNQRGRPPRKNIVSGRTEDDNETKTPQSAADGKSSSSSNQEEIISLFRRIQSSISKGDPVGSKKRSSKSSEDNSSAAAESVLEVLRKSRKQVKDKTSNKEEIRASTRRAAVSKKEQKVEDNPSVVDFKSTRPPSNFVKSSPIPHPTTPRATVFEPESEASSITVGGKELVRVEELKLTELKELAKSRGMKGYSKLKKSELVELLKL